MRKATMGRLGLMGSVAALGLVAASGGAQAYATKFGDFEVILDTTVSAGVSMRTADRATEKLAQVNGGTNVDTRVPYDYNAVAYGTLNFADLTPFPFTGNLSTAVSPVAFSNSQTPFDGLSGHDTIRS